jgi:hypothetical protein
VRPNRVGLCRLVGGGPLRNGVRVQIAKVPLALILLGRRFIVCIHVNTSVSVEPSTREIARLSGGLDCCPHYRPAISLVRAARGLVFDGRG